MVSCRSGGTAAGDSLCTIEVMGPAELSTTVLRWRPEGRCARPWITSARVSGLVRSVGFRLKGSAESSVHKLECGESVDWLGYDVRWAKEELDVRISEAWR